MILPSQSIRKAQPISPLVERSVSNGMTYGLGPAGYDVRIAEDVRLIPLGFSLASTVEKFIMPNDVIAFVHDKSTWARKGLSLFNTVIEPGWEGYLTLELMNNSPYSCALRRPQKTPTLDDTRSRKPARSLQGFSARTCRRRADAPYQGEYLQ